MRVPSADAGGVVHGHEADPGFNQSAGDQTGLAVGVASVPIAQCRRFLLNGERPAGLGGGEQIDRARLIVAQPAHGGAVGEFAEVGEVILDRFAVAELLDGDPLGQHQFRHIKIGLVRVAQCPQWIVLLTKKASKFAGGTEGTVRNHPGQRNRRGDFSRLTRREIIYDRTGVREVRCRGVCGHNIRERFPTNQ